MTDFRTPSRAKLAVGFVLVGWMTAGALINSLTPLNGLSELAWTVVGVGAAVTILDWLVPAKLMGELREKAGSIEIQARLRAYFECIALLVAAAAVFAIWYVAWQ
ncbi:hypothetical protein [Mesorhizobium sp. CN2-181]|uniref:hypothetical protein n=1 Tax=Mesorhizobium yinganensis TaxID=3157707 RepID=UPI0032B7D1D5